MENFHREISYDTSLSKKGDILLEGKMRDRWHDIYISVVVDIDSLVIKECDVDFNKTPSSHCYLAKKLLENIIGVTIGKGLLRKISEATGGSQGCSNLRTLLTGLLPLAINISGGTGLSDEQQILDAVEYRLQGTCAGYPLQ
jgi:hypothetical protein